MEYTEFVVKKGFRWWSRFVSLNGCNLWLFQCMLQLFTGTRRCKTKTNMAQPNSIALPVKRTYFLEYMGSLKVHRLYIKSMLHWIVAEVKYRRHPTFSSITIDQSKIVAKKEEKMLIDVTAPDTVLSNGNDADSISGFSDPLAPLGNGLDKNSNPPDCLPLESSLDQVVEIISPNELEKYCVGILKSPSQYDGPYTCHVFHDKDKMLIKEVSDTMSKCLTWHRKTSPQVCGNGSDQEFDCVKFEVMMLGKIQVKQEYPPPSFIDEAVDKYHSLEQEHIMEKKGSLDLPDSPFQSVSFQNGHEPVGIASSLMDGSLNGASELIRRNSSSFLPSELPPVDRQRCSSIDTPSSAAMRQRLKGRQRHCSEPSATSRLGFDKNKIRLLQIGRQSVVLICPDQSARRIEVQFTDIVRCSKGQKYKDHFGIFAKDHHTNQRNDDFKFRCYLFKCSDENVCDEIMLAMKQSCSMCAYGPDPLKSYHTLCKKINLISGATSGQVWVEHAMTIAAKFITEHLVDVEQKKTRNKIDDCCISRHVETKYEQLVVIMTVLRCLYLDKQQEHDIKLKQLKDPNASNVVSKRLNFFKSRAKKSLSSFESFFEKGFQRMHELQHEAEHHIPSPIEKLKFFGENPRSLSPGSSSLKSRNRSGSPHSGTELSPLPGSTTANNPELGRPRSNTVGAVDQSSIIARRKLNMNEEKPSETIPAQSPVKLKPLNAALSASNSSLKSISSESTPTQSRSTSPSLDIPEQKPAVGSSTGKKMSFHQEIFMRVSGSSQKKKKNTYSTASPALQNHMKPLVSLQTPDDVRYAWRRAIRDQMMLNRIRNIKTTDNAVPLENTSVKLNYKEIEPACPEMDKVWAELLATEGRKNCRMDLTVLHAAVKRGVSKNMRGEVWSLLHEQWKMRCTCSNRAPFTHTPTVTAQYGDLLKNLTPHQHAILIDLGRTFPTHPYFNQQLRSGQLDLFNLLKAYSLVDPDVGYCQGLSFVAGIILMHMSSTENSFKMLCHLMTAVGCRSLFLPDMAALRVSVYQLSRLLHDFHRDLYDHFEANDVSLMLFSTPWFLTMFASVLSFGFTARIFDLLFLEGKSALFKAALCLLNHHKHKILKEDTFEGIVCYLKNQLPNMETSEVQEILKEFFDLDIGEKLQIYEVEYAVLEDGEIFGTLDTGNSPVSVTKEMEHKITRLEHVNQTVTKYNLELAEQLEAAKMQIKSLQQGLTDMVAIDEKKSMELETIRHENQVLKRSCEM
uniref:TBC1 domain family member 1 n=1 Tax=Phallusia mammillata TaxID=59560 RepID=A0A6F9DUZ9_9ASCI|nr:TBC1 domain family member 1 [Phallusia mammillata]